MIPASTLIATSLLTLLPLPVQLLLGREWSVSMTIPLMMLAGQWLGIILTLKDPGNQKQNPKPMKTVLWTLPILSNVCCGIDYAFSSGATFDFSRILFLFLGAMFAAIGNYLPKVKMNSTIGIKTPWAYTSEENWNATHRFGGKAWFCGGILMMLSTFLPGSWASSIVLIGIFILTLLPIFYSYRYYKMQKARGDALKPILNTNSKAGKISLVYLAATLIFVGVFLFTGDIDYRFEEEYFVIEADRYDDLMLHYDVIDSVTYRDANIPGTRVWGWGSFRLLMGNFQNEEFGNYTRYTYYSPDSAVLVRYNETKVLVLSGKTPTDTLEIYSQLMEKLK